MGGEQLSLGEGFLADGDLGLGDHLDDALGGGGDDAEGEGLGEQGHPGDVDLVPLRDRSFHQASFGEGLDAGAELDVLFLACYR